MEPTRVGSDPGLNEREGREGGEGGEGGGRGRLDGRGHQRGRVLEGESLWR